MLAPVSRRNRTELWGTPCCACWALFNTRLQSPDTHQMFKATRGIGYLINIRSDDLDQIDMSALSLMLRQRTDAVWDGLDICPQDMPVTEC